MNRSLEGIQVLDLTNLLPGPFCTMRLARWGAEVIKLEKVDGGDPLRSMPPRCGSQNALFQFLNRGKKSIQVNLKSESGREIVNRLIAHCDVLVESFRPGAMARMGLDYPAAAKLNPRLVYASLSSYGSANQQPGHDLNFVSIAGLLGLYLEEGDLEPPPVQFGDLIGGMEAANQIVLGLFQRERTGRGSFLDVSLTDAVFDVVSPTIAEFLAARQSGSHFERVRLLTGQYPCYNVYQTQDGKWVSLGALEPQFWKDFCEYFGVPGLANRQFDESAKVFQKVARVFRSRSFDELAAISRETHFCLAPVYEMEDLAESDYLKDRLHEFVDPEAGPPSFPGAPGGESWLAPSPGQHTREVLLELGYCDEEISRLGERLVVAGTE